jgi:hypothetical protein
MTTPERRRYTELKSQLKKYGLTPERRADIRRAQRGVCAICGTDLNTVKECTDHIHGTVIVRGILCDGCNKMIGFAKENPEILRAGANYLEAQGHV